MGGHADVLAGAGAGGLKAIAIKDIQLCVWSVRPSNPLVAATPWMSVVLFCLAGDAALVNPFNRGSMLPSSLCGL